MTDQPTKQPSPEASARSKKAAQTRAATLTAIQKESPLAARLRSRSMAGARNAALRRDPALLVVGVTRPEYREIMPADFGRLELPDYQRGIQPDEVNELLRVLEAGGSIPDPITLSRRKWHDPANKPDRFYIVDGQQRVLAHIEAGKTIKAMVYDCASLEAERQLFVVMNTKRVVSANNIIAAASNKAAVLLREADTDPSHPCFGRIMLKAGPGTATRNMGASILLRGLAMAMSTAHTARGLTAQKLLPVLDAIFDREKADTYLRLLAEVTPIGDEHRLRLLTALALGKVYAEKATQYGRIVVPSRASVVAMRRANWEKITAGTWTRRYMPMVLEAIRERWKA
jgi:hypothetical protein